MTLNNATANSNYAKALFDLASSKGLTQKVLIELQAVYDAISSASFSKNFPQLFAVSQEKKLALITKILDSTPLEKITKNFVLLITKNSRLDHLKGILACLIALKDSEEGICKVHVSSALPLSKHSKSLLKEILESSLKKKVLIDEKTDEELLGGIRIEFLGKVLDMSIKTRLKKILECSKLN